MPKLSAQIIGLIALVVLVALVVFGGPAACNKIRSLGAQSRVDRSQFDASTNSAADAVGTVAASGEATAASEELTRANERDIRNAQGSSDKVNPAARDAGLTALCKRPAYKDEPRCKK
jgi:hypothetical protein